MLKQYPRELRERAVRLVIEHRGEYVTEYAAIRSIAARLGIATAETLRQWVRQAEVDSGQRPGTTSEESAEMCPGLSTSQIAARLCLSLHRARPSQISLHQNRRAQPTGTGGHHLPPALPGARHAKTPSGPYRVLHLTRHSATFTSDLTSYPVATYRARTDPVRRSPRSIRPLRSSRRCSRVSDVDRRSQVP
jgi:transposase-like protein